MLASNFPKDPNVRSVIEAAMSDRSYTVAGAVLRAISEYDSERAVTKAKTLESEARGSMISAIATLYSKKGGPEQIGFFNGAFDKISDPNDKYVFVQIFGKYLLKQNFETQLKGLNKLEDVAVNDGAWWMRLSAIQVLNGLRQSAERSEDADAKSLAQKIEAVITRVKQTESNSMILNMLGG